MKFIIFDELITYDELRELVGVPIVSIEGTTAFVEADRDVEIIERVRAFERDVIAERRAELDKKRAAESLERFEEWYAKQDFGSEGDEYGDLVPRSD